MLNMVRISVDPCQVWLFLVKFHLFSLSFGLCFSLIDRVLPDCGGWRHFFLVSSIEEILPWTWNCVCYVHWVVLRENLQETWFLPSNMRLSCKFSHHPILWYVRENTRIDIYITCYLRNRSKHLCQHLPAPHDEHRNKIINVHLYRCIYKTWWALQKLNVTNRWL